MSDQRSRSYCWSISLLYHKSYVLITNSLSLVNTLSCKYNYFPHISWFVLLLLQLVFTNQNTTVNLSKSVIRFIMKKKDNNRFPSLDIQIENIAHKKPVHKGLYLSIRSDHTFYIKILYLPKKVDPNAAILRGKKWINRFKKKGISGA